MANPTCTMTYSPTVTPGTYSRHTSLLTPPKSTCAIDVPSTSVMLRTRPGTARHMGVLLSRDGSAGRADHDLAEGDAAVVGRQQAGAQHGEAAFAQGPPGRLD